ncbi:MAG: polysaccharide deacetylase family protein [Bacteroidaceae bacterium]|nr:polysaccharide deacetylase family protein [Bacteroidaceae bacterium]
MFIEQVPAFVRNLYPKALWRMDPKEKAVYLTFDDGPIPVITPWVIDLLGQYNIKATFFMVGDNVRKHPQEFKQVIEAGHKVGNHTFNHLKGLFTNTRDYVENVEKADALIHSNLFRPPHGLLRHSQYKKLNKQYRFIMWDLVTRDYSYRLNGEEVLANVKRLVRNGSIITFHDSLRSEKNLKYALPRAIEWLLEQGYSFKVFE